MRNSCKIQSDGLCVYIDSQVISAKIGIIILIALNVIFWSLYLLMAISIPLDKEKGLIIPLILIPIILIFLLGRFTIWNIWGKEMIRINTKNISYQRSYGIITTNETKIKINRLGYGYGKVRYYDDFEYGKVYFYNYDADDNPDLVFETSILMLKEDAEEIIRTIDEIVYLKVAEKYDVVPLIMN